MREVDVRIDFVYCVKNLGDDLVCNLQTLDILSTRWYMERTLLR